jgi:hypothetical protein
MSNRCLKIKMHHVLLVFQLLLYYRSLHHNVSKSLDLKSMYRCKLVVCTIKLEDSILGAIAHFFVDGAEGSL